MTANASGTQKDDRSLWMIFVIVGVISILCVIFGGCSTFFSRNKSKGKIAVVEATSVTTNAVASYFQIQAQDTPISGTPVPTVTAFVIGQQNPIEVPNGCSSAIPFCYMGFTAEGGVNLYDWFGYEIQTQCHTKFPIKDQKDWWIKIFGLTEDGVDFIGGTPEGINVFKSYINNPEAPQDLRSIVSCR